MRKLLLCTPAVLFFWGCSGGDSTQAKVATSVAISPGSVNFDAIGATQVLRATVLDQNGGAMAGIPITWSTSSAAITLVPLGGDSARVTSAANGNASVNASGGAANGSVSMTVEQVPTQLVKVDGTDTQVGMVGGTLPTPVRVKLVDRLGAGVPGKTVTFTVSGGGGTVSSATAVTEADGTAAVNWTLGATPGAQAVTATFTAATTTVFTATAVNTPIGVVSPARGGDQAVMVGSAVPTTPGIIVRNLAGQPVAGVSVTFSVAAGNGTITGATTTTDATGLAAVGSWTLGSAGPNRLTATVNAGGFNNNPVVFTNYGCQGGGGGGYAITLCYTSTMTPTQRAAFENAAARWASLITGDLSNEVGDFDANDCGDNTPALSINIDDLVIFAAVTDIDGPGQVLGQATPCYIRDAAPQLTVLGMMQFDVADVANLEASDRFGAVILHEMGHVLGIGTLWNFNNLLVDRSPTSGVGLDTYYTGAGGRAGFDAIGGLTYTGGQKVPVENTGGGGTVNSHWRESVLKNELMTGFLNAGQNPLSVLTVRSLADLGYTVNP
ncbi:MAG TPA: leishmanolysin-related zinc metalloendopeptidase, partial [Longimicrobium sp.]|nr:leishmanolysin-related zinc metalloendopeptidase [Longimicrobium sp.]